MKLISVEPVPVEIHKLVIDGRKMTPSMLAQIPVVDRLIDPETLEREFDSIIARHLYKKHLPKESLHHNASSFCLIASVKGQIVQMWVNPDSPKPYQYPGVREAELGFGLQKQ